MKKSHLLTAQPIEMVSLSSPSALDLTVMRTREGVHVVTVNDYLARRDAEWVGQPLRFLGMTVGVVQYLGCRNKQKSIFFCWCCRSRGRPRRMGMVCGWMHS